MVECGKLQRGFVLVPLSPVFSRYGRWSTIRAVFVAVVGFTITFPILAIADVGDVVFLFAFALGISGAVTAFVAPVRQPLNLVLTTE